MKTDLAVPPLETNPVRALSHSPGFLLALMLFGHPLLALAMRYSALVAAAHAYLVLAVGVWFALFSKDLRKAGYAAAYIAGAEVLWRMTDARIFWEAGKYFTILILGLALLRIRPWRGAALPIVFFLLLCISIPLTLLGLDPASARSAISFNLSGPLALAVCALYFSQVKFDPASLRFLVRWIVFPVLGIAAVALAGTLSAGTITFIGESNFVTSGGFGPNQVSAMLGLGGGLLVLLFLTGRQPLGRLAALLLGLVLFAQSVLTFSRGGFYNAIFMVALALVHFLRSPRGRMIAITALFTTGVLGGYFIFPRLNSFTGGMLEQRFSDYDLAVRGQLIQADLALWAGNPLFGVGPGLSTSGAAAFVGFEVAPHTEYTRLLAEHGTAGLLALLIMLIMSLRAYLRAPCQVSRMWVAALLGWSFMEMSHAAMRIVAISFLFGLALTGWEKQEPARNDPDSRRPHLL